MRCAVLCCVPRKAPLTTAAFVAFVACVRPLFGFPPNGSWAGLAQGKSVWSNNAARSGRPAAGVVSMPHSFVPRRMWKKPPRPPLRVRVQGRGRGWMPRGCKRVVSAITLVTLAHHARVQAQAPRNTWQHMALVNGH